MYLYIRTHFPLTCVCLFLKKQYIYIYILSQWKALFYTYITLLEKLCFMRAVWKIKMLKDNHKNVEVEQKISINFFSLILYY